MSRPARGWSRPSCARARTARSSALDQSPQMLAAARARFAGEGARVELIEGEAERLPFEDASFDALTFTYLLRYVDDPPATMRELARVVRPGGRVASLEFGVPPRRARARGLAVVHGDRPADARARGLARVGGGRALPRAEHQRLLREAPAGADRRLLAGRGAGRCAGAADEPRRRGGDVGTQARRGRGVRKRAVLRVEAARL